jgi:hypothetical protein
MLPLYTMSGWRQWRGGKLQKYWKLYRSNPGL